MIVNVCKNRQHRAYIDFEKTEFCSELMMRKPTFVHTPRQQKS